MSPGELPPRPAAGLGASLRLISAYLPAALVDAEAAGFAASVAAKLPAVHFAGFECRLAAGATAVDFQQGITATPDNRDALCKYLDGRPPEAAAWRGVRRLCQSWSSPQECEGSSVSQLWFEVDAGAAVSEGGDEYPSVLAVLRPTGSAAARSAAHDVLAALAPARQMRTLAAVLDRCADACPAEARVSHIGVMLGRAPAAMRINILGVGLGYLGPYLAGIGWTGDAEEVCSLARMLLAYADLVVLCLDVVGDVLPRAGFECFFAQRHGVDRHWGPLLTRLVDGGLASPGKADALLTWPGVVTPPEAQLPWPDDLIMRSCSQPVGTFGVIERRLSHLKLTWAPGRPVEAKAYFGFLHRWESARGEPVGPSLLPPVRPPTGSVGRRGEGAPGRSEVVGGDIRAAMDAAVQYLVTGRNQSGWWRDFSDRGQLTAAGEPRLGPNSDEWVTAYVAAALAGVPDRRARAAAEQALDMLMARREADVGWGYDVQSAPDADSTTWVLRLAFATHAPVSEQLVAARQFVAGHINAEGGVATYRPAALAPPGQPQPRESVAGWCSAHGCVTAAAAVLDLGGVADMLSYLGRVQRADGSWAGYWWDDDEYATARATEALASHERYRAAVARAVAWAAGRIGAAGGVWSGAASDLSPFATALTLQTVLQAHAPEPGAAGAAAARAVRWLVESQREDGSWIPSARLRIPEPGLIDPLASPGTTGTYVDGKSFFTTATVLTALRAARMAGGSVARSGAAPAGVEVG